MADAKKCAMDGCTVYGARGQEVLLCVLRGREEQDHAGMRLRSSRVRQPEALRLRVSVGVMRQSRGSSIYFAASSVLCALLIQICTKIGSNQASVTG